MNRDKKSFWLGLTIATAMLSTASLGKAQPRDNPIERARRHMELGQEAFVAGRYEEAADQFISAYTASPFSAFLYNAGLAYDKGGVNDKAAELYRRYLEAEPEASDYGEVEVRIRALLAVSETPKDTEAPAVSIVESEMKSLISIRTNPSNARIRILDAGGKAISEAQGPAAQTVVKGTYTVEVSHPDYRTVQTDIAVASGQVYIVVVEMSQGAFLGFLQVTTDVPGAAVFVDSKEQGKVGETPWGNVLPIGEHTIWVEKPGYEPLEVKTKIELGESRDLNLTLERPQFGILLLKSNLEGAEVFVDGEPFGIAPLEEKIAPGRHKVKVLFEGMKDYETELGISRGQTSKLLVRMNSVPSRTSAWVSLGFSLGLFAGGGAAGFVALHYNNELDSLRNEGRLANDDPRILRGFLWGLGADVAFGLGAVVGGLSIYYFLRDPLPPSEGKLSSPEDFTENPADLSPPKKRKAKPVAENDGRKGRRSERHFSLFPIIVPSAPGLGLAVVF